MTGNQTTLGRIDLIFANELRTSHRVVRYCVYFFQTAWRVTVGKTPIAKKQLTGFILKCRVFLYLGCDLETHFTNKIAGDCICVSQELKCSAVHFIQFGIQGTMKTVADRGLSQPEVLLFVLMAIRTVSINF